MLLLKIVQLSWQVLVKIIEAKKHIGASISSTIFGLEYHLRPDRHRAIIWTNAEPNVLKVFSASFVSVLIKLYMCWLLEELNHYLAG